MKFIVAALIAVVAAEKPWVKQCHETIKETFDNKKAIGEHYAPICKNLAKEPTSFKQCMKKGNLQWDIVDLDGDDHVDRCELAVTMVACGYADKKQAIKAAEATKGDPSTYRKNLKKLCKEFA